MCNRSENSLSVFWKCVSLLTGPLLFCVISLFWWGRLKVFLFLPESSAGIVQRRSFCFCCASYVSLPWNLLLPLAHDKILNVPLPLIVNSGLIVLSRQPSKHTQPWKLPDAHEAWLPHSHSLPSPPNVSLFNLLFSSGPRPSPGHTTAPLGASPEHSHKGWGSELAGISSGSVTTDENDKQEGTGFVVPR